MKKLLQLSSILFLGLILLGGCSTKRSEITLNNLSTSTLDLKVNGDPITIAPNQSYVDFALLDKFLFFEETRRFHISYEGFIYLAPDNLTITLRPDKDEELNLRNNRAGIQINNQSTVPISEIRLRNIGSDDWSSNYMQETTVASSFRFSARAKQVDLKLIDSTEREFVLNDTISLQVGETANVYFDSINLNYYGE